MRVPLNWLKDYVSVNLSAENLAEKLTLAGLEVEALETIEGETILELGLTANRGDCLSLRGVARELAAILRLPLKKTSQSQGLKIDKGVPPIKVTLKAQKACPRYTACGVSGVTIGPSPSWLVRRLNQVGIRSVNNVVDATNYIMMDRGQPLHVFDARCIAGRHIIVRFAKKDETLTTLDEKKQVLNPKDLLISDSEKPLALAGVMGGLNSEVKEDTTGLILESAYFDPATVRQTSKRLGLSSESSYRFERHVDPEGTLEALQDLASLILRLSPCAVVGPAVNCYPKPFRPKTITLSMQEVERHLGTVWNEKAVLKTFQAMGLKIRRGKKAVFSVAVPPYRGDLTRPIDLIEEVARLGGYDKIPETFPVQKEALAPEDQNLQRTRAVKNVLKAQGYYETIHYSFCAPERLKNLDPQAAGQGIPVDNPLNMELSLLRPTLLISLIEAADYNLRRGNKNLRLFELRPVYRQGWKIGTKEPLRLAALQTGMQLPHYWGSGLRQATFFDLKGSLEAVLETLHIREYQFLDAEISYFHPGKSARLLIRGQEAGIIGELHPRVKGCFELTQDVSLFELDCDLLLKEAATVTSSFRQISQYPSVERDVALVVEDSVPAYEIYQTLTKGVSPCVRSVRLFDLYQGEQISNGKKSLAWAIQYGRDDATMTEEEVSVVHEELISKLKATFNATIR